MGDLPDKLNEFIPEGGQSKVKELLDRMFDRDCPDEDCSELLSPCCSGKLSIVFGTLPVEVECRICGNKAFLRDLVTSEKS